MKIITIAGIAFFALASSVHADGDGDCLSAWKQSSASKSCPSSGTVTKQSLTYPDKCIVDTTCYGKKVTETSAADFGKYVYQTTDTTKGSYIIPIEDLKKVSNCDGKLKPPVNGQAVKC